MDKFIPRRKVLEILKITAPTLYKMIDREEIETLKIGTRTLYNLEKYMRDHNIMNKDKQKKICYCRVSSKKQKDDLERQINYMKEKYPNHEIMSDIGSGINMNRLNLKKIMEMAIKGEISEVVVTYKDRLARFGYEMIEWLLVTYSKAQIIIVNKDEEETPTEELVKDIIQIMNVYTAKINGLRKYGKKMETMIKDERIKME